MSFGSGKGGGGSAPKIKIPRQLTNNISNADDVSRYAATYFQPLESMATWASDIATGGAATQPGQVWSPPGKTPFTDALGNFYGVTNYPAFTGSGGQAAPGGFATGMTDWQPGMTPWSGGAAQAAPAGVPGATGAPGFQAAAPPPAGAVSNQTTLTQSQIDQLKSQGYQGLADQSGNFIRFQAGMTVNPQDMLAGGTPGQQANPTLAKYFGLGTGPQGQAAPAQGGGRSWQQVGEAVGLSPADIAAFQREGLTPDQVAAKFGIGGTGGGSNILGPFLSNAVGAINTQAQVASRFPPGTSPGEISNLENRFFGLSAQDAAKTAEQMPGGKLPASGLYPQQQAMIDAQTKAAQEKITQQLASEGLNSSTQGAMLRGEIGQQGAAEAGQLIAGNISLAQQAQGLAAQWQQVGQQWARLGAGEQTLGMAEQEQMFTMFGQIAQENQGLQSQMWSEAMQGYGMLGNFVDTVLKGFGLSIQGSEAILQANTEQAQIQANMEAASMQQQSSSSSSMFGALGSLFGGGGGGGGLLGGLGSLFGGGAGAAGALGGSLGAGEAAGAAAGGGSAIAGIASAISAAFSV